VTIAERNGLLTEAARKMCSLCRPGAPYYGSIPECDNGVWVHQPTQHSLPTWEPVACKAGVLHDMMEEL